MELTTMEKLKIVMDRRGFTFSDVARILNKSPQSVSMLFKSDNISLKKLNEICAAIGVKMVIEFKEN